MQGLKPPPPQTLAQRLPLAKLAGALLLLVIVFAVRYAMTRPKPKPVNPLPLRETLGIYAFELRSTPWPMQVGASATLDVIATRGPDPLTGASLNLNARRPGDHQPVGVNFKEYQPGHYSGDLPVGVAGDWTVNLAFRDGSTERSVSFVLDAR